MGTSMIMGLISGILFYAGMCHYGSSIGKKKGYNRQHMFLLVFFIPIIGFAIVFILPSKNDKEKIMVDIVETETQSYFVIGKKRLKKQHVMEIIKSDKYNFAILTKKNKRKKVKQIKAREYAEKIYGNFDKRINPEKTDKFVKAVQDHKEGLITDEEFEKFKENLYK